MELEKYRGWSIIQNNDGIICLDPKGSNCLPGAVSHSAVKDARKSIDYYILANGDAHKFWLLHGRAGVESVADRSDYGSVDGATRKFVVSKRDNPKYEPTYEYRTTIEADRSTGFASLKLEGKLGSVNLTMGSAEELLATANLMREAAMFLLGKNT